MKKLSQTLLSLLSRLPWWLWMVLAAAAYAVLRWYSSPADVGAGLWPEAGRGYVQGLADALQYILPLLLLLASAGSFFWRWKRRSLFSRIARKTPEALARLSRGDFLFLVAEFFRGRGFEVTQAGVRPGDGVDMVAVKGGERYYIRCVMKSAAGIQEVRPLVESAVADEAAGGMAVTVGEFAAEAADCIAKTRIRLINGRELHRDIQLQNQEKRASADKKNPVITAVKWSFVVLLILSMWGVALLATEQGRSLAFATLEKFSNRVSLFNRMEQTPVPAETSGEDDSLEGSRLSPERLRQALEDILRPDGQKPAPPRYRYEIELHSGGWIYTDNIVMEDDRVTYTSKRGLEVSINRNEIRTLKRVREKR